MKKFLLVTALFEAITGLLLLVFPLLITSMLLGAESLAAVAVTIVRIAGAALLSLAVACWYSRQTESAVPVVKALLFYNIAVASVLIYGKFASGLTGFGLFPAVGAHLLLAVWGIVVLKRKSAQP